MSAQEERAREGIRLYLRQLLAKVDLEERRRGVRALRERFPSWSDEELCAFLIDRQAARAAAVGAATSVPCTIPFLGYFLSLGTMVLDFGTCYYLVGCLAAELTVAFRPRASFDDVVGAALEVLGTWAEADASADDGTWVRVVLGKAASVANWQGLNKAFTRYLARSTRWRILRYVPGVGMAVGAVVDYRLVQDFGWAAVRVLKRESA